MNQINTFTILATAMFMGSALSSRAQTIYTYAGGSNNWSNTAAWSPTPPATGPTTGDTAVIGSALVSQTVSYDSATSGSLGTLTLNENTAGVVNELDISGNSLTVTNTITLGASAGTTEIALESARTLTDLGGLNINSGGNLTFNANATVGGTTTVTLAGGTINYGTNVAVFVGNLNSTSGTITGSGGVFLEGASNSLLGLTGSTLHNVTLQSMGVNQTLTSNVALTGQVTIKTGGAQQTAIIADSAGASTINLDVINNYHNAVLQLGSNLVVGNLTASGTGGDVVGFNIDTAGFALTDNNATGFVPTNPAGSKVTWTLDDSTNNGGVFSAPLFNLSVATTGNGGVSVNHDLTLNATGGASANNLGNSSGTISPTSTFLYTGGGSSTLTSNRIIGNLAVGNGTSFSTLQVVTATLPIAGAVTVNANSALDLNGQNVTETGTATGTSLGGLSGSGTVINSGNGAGTAATLTLNTTHGNGNFSGLIDDDSVSGTPGTTAVVLNGTGTQTLSGANTYSGGTLVNAGTLLLTNGTNGSATGRGPLTVQAGATIGGAGSSTTSTFAVNGNVQVGNGTDTTSQTTLSATSASTFTNAKLTFNLDSASTNSNVLNIGNTGLTFSNTTLQLTISGANGIAGETPYTLIAGTGGETYSGFTTTTNNMGQAQINTGGGLMYSFTNSTAAAYTGSYLFVSGDDIDIEVVPEPGTWAMLLGGLALLVVWQQRRRLAVRVV